MIQAGGARIRGMLHAQAEPLGWGLPVHEDKSPRDKWAQAEDDIAQVRFPGFQLPRFEDAQDRRLLR